MRRDARRRRTWRGTCHLLRERPRTMPVGKRTPQTAICRKMWSHRRVSTGVFFSSSVSSSWCSCAPAAAVSETRTAAIGAIRAMGSGGGGGSERLYQARRVKQANGPGDLRCFVSKADEGLGRRRCTGANGKQVGSPRPCAAVRAEAALRRTPATVGYPSAASDTLITHPAPCPVSLQVPRIRH